MYDVHIIGAGIAGGVAAERLVRKSYKVLISEEDRKIGYPKHCTGVLSVKALESTGIATDRIKLNYINGSHIYGSDFKEILAVKRREIQAYVIDRPYLEEIIVNKAIDQGAKIELGKKVSKINQLEGKYIVGADGPNSTIAKLYNFPKIGDYVIGYQEEIENKDLINDHKVRVYLSKKYFPGFFGWIVPIEDGRAIVGYGHKPNLKNHKINIEIRIKKMLNSIGIYDYKKLDKYGGLIPLGLRKKIVNGNVLLIGDAGGFVKSTSGGGVLFASISAKKAVKAISEDQPHKYADLVMEEIKELKEHYRIRKLYNFTPEMITTHGVRLIRNHVEKWLLEKGDMDYASKLFK